MSTFIQFEDHFLILGVATGNFNEDLKGLIEPWDGIWTKGIPATTTIYVEGDHNEQVKARLLELGYQESE